MKFIFAVFIMLSYVSVQANDFLCNVKEKVNNVVSKKMVDIKLNELSEGLISLEKNQEFKTAGTICLKDQATRWSILDSTTGYLIEAKTGLSDGATSQVMLLGPVDKDEFFITECVYGGSIQKDTKAPINMACSIEEQSNEQFSNQVDFTVPIAKNGHDKFAMPISSGNIGQGWVLAYNGILLVFIQNTQTYAGVTALGSWDKAVSLAWYPNKENKKIQVRCQPNF